jgi:hypothetical protein
MRRYALRDWDRMPGREGHVGVTAKDNRLFMEAVIYRFCAGAVEQHDVEKYRNGRDQSAAMPDILQPVG